MAPATIVKPHEEVGNILLMRLLKLSEVGGSQALLLLHGLGTSCRFGRESNAPLKGQPTR